VWLILIFKKAGYFLLQACSIHLDCQATVRVYIALVLAALAHGIGKKVAA
jgi:hypothetical protein